MTTDDYRPSLKKVGFALIAIGVVDIGLMIYCIVHGRNYSSSFNIFAVIAGILLFRGGLRTANIVAFFSAMILINFIGLFLLLPIFMPFDLICTYWRLYPYAVLGSALFWVIMIVFLSWTYRTLTVPSIAAAIAEKYPKWTSWRRRPRTGFFVGLILVSVVCVLLNLMMRGSTADRAVIEAKRKVGENYKFQVMHLNMFTSGGRTQVRAIVTAYTDKEIRTVPVEWQQ